MTNFLDVKQGERVAFRLSRAQWEALPFVDEAATPEHMQVFRDRERFGVVYRWLGGPQAGAWWMACVIVDDGRAPARRRRPLDVLRSTLGGRAGKRRS
ncbi:MAG: hypothetical protein U1F37_16865 [Alphaproteobacteria bacterium]